VDSAGNLYVSDTGNERILKYDSPFTTNTVGDRALSCDVPCKSQGMALDHAGRLYVADQGNNRVLEFDSPLTNQNADRVFGQPDFTTFAPNQGGLSSSSMFNPGDVALDSSGNLFVADTSNNRVLEFDSPTTNAVADRVFGQNGSFVTNGCGPAGPGTTCAPNGVALDASGNLWVATQSRGILEFEQPFASTTLASFVLGGDAFGMSFDSADNFFVPSVSDNRVLRYPSPPVNGGANLVLGQMDFTHTAANNLNGKKLSSILPVTFPAVAIDTSVTPNRLYIAD
jgi:sugar lactone lactonase YvrE